MASLIGFLREVKDPSNIFELKRSFGVSNIMIKNMRVFLDIIQKYHTDKMMNLDNDVIFYTLQRTHLHHFMIYEDGNIFVHYCDYNKKWRHTHLLKNEIFDDDINLCLSKGRILFEEL